MGELVREDLLIRASDGAFIPVSLFAPDRAPSAWIHIHHGMGEHRRRYLGLIESLVEANYFVSIQDHRGHGSNTEKLGDFGPSGWRALVSDAREVLSNIAERAPTHQLILLGHSMGTLVSQQLLKSALPSPIALRGLVLSGHPGRLPKWLVQVLLAIIKLERRRLSGDRASTLLRFLVFGRANSAFARELPRSGFEWLSKDIERVRDYVSDPYCGHFVTIDSFESMMRADLEYWAREPQGTQGSSLPVYFISGANDPLHAGQRLLNPVMQAFQASGWRLNADIYPEGRHEMFQETNRDEVIARLLRIINEWV